MIWPLLVTFLALVACEDGARDGPEEPEAIYSIVLTDAGDRKIAVIKMIREVTGLGLRDAKDLADSSPSVIHAGLSHAAAEAIADKFVSVGASVELKSQR